MMTWQALSAGPDRLVVEVLQVVRWVQRRVHLHRVEQLLGRRAADVAAPGPLGKGLHTSTFRLKVSTFCWIRWVHDFKPVYKPEGRGEV